MVDPLVQYMNWAAKLAQRVGPYLLLEILLPGGTLLAFLLYASRHGRHLTSDPAASPLRIVLEVAIRIVRNTLERIPVRGPGRSLDASPERDGLEPLAMSPI